MPISSRNPCWQKQKYWFNNDLGSPLKVSEIETQEPLKIWWKLRTLSPSHTLRHLHKHPKVHLGFQGSLTRQSLPMDDPHRLKDWTHRFTILNLCQIAQKKPLTCDRSFYLPSVWLASYLSFPAICLVSFKLSWMEHTDKGSFSQLVRFCLFVCLFLSQWWS